MTELELTYLLIIIVLIACSAFFSGSETGLTASSRGKIYKMKMEGNKKAGLVTDLYKNKDALIGTILLGNNCINILASALATSLAIQLWGEQGVIYATIIMTTLILVFAEVLPKTYALYNAEKTALFSSVVLTFLVKILSPITHIVQIMVDSIINILGMKKQSTDTLTVVEELRGTIEMHHKAGKVGKRDRDMLGSILDLTETEISEIMVHRKNMLTIGIDQPTGKFIEQVVKSNYTRIPVWKDNKDNIIGILHTKSLLGLLYNNKEQVTTDDIMQYVSPPWFVPETNSLNNQLMQFRQKCLHLAMVVDEYGDVVGLVTLEDILEEIVGQINDEHDLSTTQVKRLAGGAIEVDGQMSIRDLNRSMDWKLPDDNANTIAGLIIFEAKTIPVENDEFIFYDFTFRILECQENRVTKLIITPNK